MKEIKSKFEVINNEKLFIEIKLPTKILLWKFWLGKNNKPKKRPHNIEHLANLELIFLL